MRYLKRFNESVEDEVCINFVEWAATKLFQPRYTGISYYKMNDDFDFGDIKMDPYYFNYPGTRGINGLNLYKLFCEDNGLTLTSQNELDFYKINLKPLEFFKFIIDKKLFYYRYTFNGVQQKPYWTNNKGNVRFNTNDLYKNFISK